MADQGRELDEALHPIQVVSRRTGLRADVIRAWERRYGAVSPQRGSGSRRLYSDSDVERLGLLRQATLAGRRIGDVTPLSNEELRGLVADDVAVRSSPTARAPGSATEVAAGARVEACLRAAARLDPQALETELYAAAVDMTVPALLDELLSPLFQQIGEEVRAGRLRVAHEHLATAVARAFLTSLRPLSTPGSVIGPRLIVTTPSGQVHELGALMAAVTAASQGWEVLYLGPNLPADEIAAAARQVGAGAVALSIICLDAELRLAEELRRLRRQLPEVTLFVGGMYARERGVIVEEIGAIAASDYVRFREQLDALRPQLSR